MTLAVSPNSYGWSPASSFASPEQVLETGYMTPPQDTASFTGVAQSLLENATTGEVGSAENAGGDVPTGTVDAQVGGLSRVSSSGGASSTLDALPSDSTSAETALNLIA